MKIDNNEINNDLELNQQNWNNDLLDDDLLNEWDWVKSLKELRKKENDKNKLNNILKGIFILVFLLFIWVYWMYKFFEITSSEKEIWEYEKQYVDFIWKNFFSSVDAESFDNNSTDPFSRAKNMKSYIENKWILFYDKIESLKNFYSQIDSSYKTNMNSINNLHTSLVKYKFLPKELKWVLKDIKLTPILLTLESIKLYIIDYVYLKTWEFDYKILDNVKDKNANYAYLNSKSNWRLASYIKKDIQSLRELWVKVYLQDIVFNYMYRDLDSDKFSKEYFITSFYNENKSLLDKRCWIKNDKWNKKCSNFWNISLNEFVSKYISIIWDIYKQTLALFNSSDKKTLPVDISLLNYDPKTQMLSFRIKIMLKEWLTDISVVNLATKIITLLRESRLIIWKDISINKIRVNNIIIRNNWRKVYKATNLTFRTSVQSEVNVEVTDSILNK